MAYISILFFLFFSDVAHDFHLTFTHVDVEGKEIHLTFKFFTNDLAEIIEQKYAKKINFDAEDNATESLFYAKKYILDHFKLTVKSSNETLNWQFQKRKIKDDAVWFYFDITCKQKIREIRLKNELLLDKFPDQQNLLILNFNNTQKATNFNYKLRAMNYVLN